MKLMADNWKNESVLLSKNQYLIHKQGREIQCEKYKGSEKKSGEQTESFQQKREKEQKIVGTEKKGNGGEKSCHDHGKMKIITAIKYIYTNLDELFGFSQFDRSIF